LNKTSKSAAAITRDVTCPFCGILCDDLVIQKKQDEKLKILENGCPRAIAFFEKEIPGKSPKIGGKTAASEEAIDAVCRILKKARTPLIAGLGSDVAGMRQVMHLAEKTGAVLDHMHGNGLIRDTLVLQSHGWIMTTMAEIRNRADLVIFAGTDATNYPRFFERVIWNEQTMFNLDRDDRHIVYIGDKLDTRAGINPNGKRPTVLKCKTEQIGEIISGLHALVADASIDVSEVSGISVKTLKTLAGKMKSAKYGVIIWSPGELDIPHAEITIQNFCELVKFLTRITRFSGFSLGGNDGATTANNVCAWQTGYPLRVNFNRGYPDYDAYRYTTSNMLGNSEVDALVWISSFSPEINSPRTTIPTVVLGTPDSKLNFTPDVFIPVATPGVDHSGHLFRTDSVVVLPLKQLRNSSHASVASILNQVIERL
jgi:formylmethanofuran dehydrogenase subunit B